MQPFSRKHLQHGASRRAAGLSVILWRQVEYASGNADYKKAEGLAGVSIQQLPQPAPSSPESARPSPDPAPASGAPEDTDPNLALLGSIDLAALQAVNPDVFGWIEIPGTIISYPLLQGADNNKGPFELVILAPDKNNPGQLREYNTNKKITKDIVSMDYLTRNFVSVSTK